MEFNASWLKEHLDVPFDVLGYWYELMKIAKDVPARDWMKVYANLLTLKCKSMSLREFQEKRKGFGSFCVFLDEFSTEPWSVFTRNLARTAGITCIVVNTNSEIVNLADIFSLGVPATVIWSNVLTRLNATPATLIKAARARVNFLRSQCAGLDDPRTLAAFNHVFSVGIKNSRT